jgi:hypothetical protein
MESKYQKQIRIERIKKISGYLRLLLTGCLYFYPVLILSASLIATFPSSIPDMLLRNLDVETQKSIGERILTAANQDVSARVAFLLFFPPLCAPFWFVMRHLRDLMSLYSLGEIFNEVAIDHARRALGITKALVVLGLTVEGFVVIGAFFTHQEVLSMPGFSEFVFDFIKASVLIGLLQVLFWTLEIGADLNQESELTI